MRKILAPLAATAGAAALVLSVAAPALAAVDFDPATGTGFVGKGDVQLAYGLNNKQLQAKADQVKFLMIEVTTEDVVCETAGRRSTTRRIKEERTNTKATIAYDLRQRNQITGFTLTGFDGTPRVTETGGCTGQSVEVAPNADEAPLLTSSSEGVLRSELDAVEADLYSY